MITTFNENKRAIIFGGSGSGKTYFLKELGSKLKGSSLYFDNHLWTPRTSLDLDFDPYAEFMQQTIQYCETFNIKNIFIDNISLKMLEKIHLILDNTKILVIMTSIPDGRCKLRQCIELKDKIRMYDFCENQTLRINTWEQLN